MLKLQQKFTTILLATKSIRQLVMILQKMNKLFINYNTKHQEIYN